MNLAEVLIIGFLPTLEQQQDNQYYNTNNTANTNEPKYTLSMEILDYLNKVSPLMAGLACIFCAPSNTWSPNFIRFALPAVKDIHPVIANWIRLKSYAQSYFSYIFLHDSKDDSKYNSTSNLSQGSFSDFSQMQAKTNTQFSNEEKKWFELINQEELKYESQFFSQVHPLFFFFLFFCFFFKQSSR